MSSDTCKRMMSDGDACVNTTTDTDVAPATIRAIVAGHGSFASGIISAVEQITGKGASFLAMSNTGINLAPLLDFAMQGASDPVVAVNAALERGRVSMAVYGA